MSASGRLTFGFTRSAKKSSLKPSKVLSDGIDSKDNFVDYLTSFENCAPHSAVNSSSDEIVIPLRLSRSNIREKLEKKYFHGAPTDKLTTEALKSLSSGKLSDSSRFSAEDIQTINHANAESCIVEDVDDADYNQVPVENFGLALLKGMGLKDNNTEQLASSDYLSKVRLKGLGLGADPKVLKKARESTKDQVVVSQENLVFKIGAKCQIVFGRSSGLYGTIEGFDGDIGRVIVRLAMNKQIVKVMQATVRVVSNTEFEKFKYYSNKTEIKQKKRDYGLNSLQDPENGTLSQSASACGYFTAKRRREDGTKDTYGPTWLKNGLIVRYLDKESKYYLQKVRVLSISPSSNSSCRCSCETENGNTLKNIREVKLQTTIPKHLGGYVVVVKGDYSGNVGKLIGRNDSSLRARISLHTIKKEVTLHYDDICCFDTLQ